MSEQTEVRLIWREKDTIDAIQACLASQTWIKATLPLDYNPVLFTRLMPNAFDGELEQANIQGDMDLLREAPRITGFDDLARLIKPLSRLSTHVSGLTPPSILLLCK